MMIQCQAVMQQIYPKGVTLKSQIMLTHSGFCEFHAYVSLNCAKLISKAKTSVKTFFMVYLFNSHTEIYVPLIFQISDTFLKSGPFN